MADESPIKPTKYFIDFENVHGPGLKGVDELSASDEVIIIYSQAAETFHIEHAIDILKSKARIEFVEVDGGTRNAADFQLIVALFGDMSDEFDYAIVSGDGGFDAAIKMGERMGLPAVRRMANIRGDIEPDKPEKPKSRRTRRRNGQTVAAQAEASQEPEDEPMPDSGQSHQPVSAPKTDSNDQAAQAPEPEKPVQEREGQPSRSSRRRSRRKAAVAQEQAVETGEPDQQGQRNQEARPQEEEPAQQVEPVKASDAGLGDSAEEAAPKRRPRRRRRGQGPKDEIQSQASQPEASEPFAKDGATSADLAPEPAAVERGDASASAAAASSSEAEDELPMTKENPVDAEPASKHDQIKTYFEHKDVQLDEVQLEAVANALDGVKGRQDFYHRIIRALKQQKGRALYRLVRDHYEALMALE